MTHTSPAVAAKPATTNGDSTSAGAGLPQLADGGGSVVDVIPAWNESLPAWADDLVALFSSGQSWPEASERLMWDLARAHHGATGHVFGSVDSVGSAAVAVLAGMRGRSTQAFLDRLGRHYSEDDGLIKVAQDHFAYAAKADGFARETQYSKLQVNAVFWVALIAVFIAAVAAVYTSGGSTRLIGAIAARARAETDEILRRLAIVAGRPASAYAVAEATKLARFGLLGRILANPVGREFVEELGEEQFGDAFAQRKQQEMGTRDGWDWKLTGATTVGTLTGTGIGVGIARPVSNLVNRMPLIRRLNTDAPGFGNAFRRFPGRALTTGLTNVIASPAGSVVANGLVYGQWELPDGESLLGAALSGAARTNTISPFNPDVAEAVLSPRTALAGAFDTAARTDLIRALSNASPDPAAGQSSGGAPESANTGGAGGGQAVNGGGPTGWGGTNTAAASGQQPSGGSAAGSSGSGAGSSGSGRTTAATSSGSTQAASAPSGGSGQSSGSGPSSAAGGASGANPGGAGAANAGGANPGARGSGSTTTAGTANASAANSGQSPTAAAQHGQQGAQGQPGAQSGVGQQSTHVQPAVSGQQSASGQPSASAQQSAPGQAGVQGAPGQQAAGSTQAAGTSGADPAGSGNATSTAGASSTGSAGHHAGGSVTPSTASGANPAGSGNATGTAGGSATGSAGHHAGGSATPGTASGAVSSAGGATSASGAVDTGTTGTGQGSMAGATSTGNAGGATNPGNATAAGRTAAASANASAGTSTPTPGGAPSSASVSGGSTSSAAPSPAASAPAAASGTTGGSTSASATAAHASARTAVSDVLFAIAPDVLFLHDGQGAWLTGPDGRPVELSGEDLDIITDRLTTRAAESVDTPRLRAEAAALLGARIAERSLDLPAEGALDALARLADATPDGRAAAVEVAGEVLEDNPRGLRFDHLSEAGARMVEVAAKIPPLGPDHVLRVGRSSAIAADIVRRAEALAGISSTGANGPANPAGGGQATEASSNTGNAPAANSGQTAGPSESPGTQPESRTPRGRGQVTARPIERTRFVADGRPPHLADLSQQEAEQGFLSLRASDLGPDVTGLSTTGEQTVVVNTGRFGAQHLRYEIGPVRDGRLARTRVRSGTADDPHVVRLSPRLANDVLPRVWLHEISDVLQRLSAPRQGVIRSFLRVTAKPDPTACVTARYREHALLARQWRAAPAQDRPAVAHEIEQLGREIERLGRAAPEPPWSAPQPSSAASSTTSGTAAQTSAAQSPADPVAELLELARTQRETLTEATKELRKAAEKKNDSAKAADADAKEAQESADKASSETDNTAGERRRKALADRDGHLATAERARRSNEAYAQAAQRAVEASRAYETLENALNALPEGRKGTLPEEIARLAREAQAAHTTYKEALENALPSTEVLTEATLAGRLPHLERLTWVVNNMLERAGVDHRYAPDELSHVLRANFRWLVAQEGVVLRVGRGTRAELRLRLKVSDLVEVFDHPVQHSQSMLGQLPQGGRSAAVTANRSVRFAPNLDLIALGKPLKYISVLGRVAAFLILRGGAAFGRSESFNGNASEFALGGAVQDNKGEALVLDGLASVEVELRTAGGTKTERVVDSGTSGDAPSLRVYVPHAHAQRGPAEVVRLPQAERQRTPFPEHAVTGLTGLQELAEGTAEKAGRSEIGSMTRDQILTIMTKELPARLGEAINDPEGLRRPIWVRGRVVGYVQVKSRVVMDTARPVGTPSTKHRLERLRVGFSGASGSRTAGWSTEVKGTAGAQVPIRARRVLNAFGLARYKSYTPRATGGYGRSWSGSRSMSAGGTAIRPSVQRWAGHTQAYALELEHTVTVQLNTDDVPQTPVTGRSTGLFRMPEPQAYRYGLPVDRAAVRKDGSLRDDPKPGVPKGRLPKLPEWLRGKGAGPGLVQESEQYPESVKNFAEVREKVVTQLRARGLLPDENGRLSRDPLTRASQIANMIEVAEQFSSARLQTGYDQAMQDGIILDLVHQAMGRASRHFTVRIKLQQSGEEEFRGTSDADIAADLDISSETSGRSVSRSAGSGWEAGGGVDLKTKRNQAGSTGGEGGYHSNNGRTISTTLNDTVNQVTLIESTSPLAVFEVPHVLTVDLIENGKATPLAQSEDVWMRVLLPSDILPEDRTEPSPSHPTSPEALRLATLLHVDGSGVLDSLQSVLPKAMRPGSVSFHHLAEAFNVRNLISHPEWLLADPNDPATTYGTALAVRPRGLRTHRASAWITAQPGESTFVTAADLVIGDINMTMGARTTKMETHTNRSVDGSTGGIRSLLRALTGKGKIGASWGWSESESISDTEIWARERLPIDTGRQYVFAMKADVTVSGDEEGNRQAGAEPLKDRTVVYSIPERDALDLYGKGRLKLPLSQVADAVTRLLDGNLKLDPRTSVPLVRRYLADRMQARKDDHPRPDLEDKHPRAALIERLVKDFPMKLAAEKDRLEQMHDKLPDLAIRVDVPDLYQDSLGESTVKAVELRDADGKPTELIKQVRDRIGMVAPGALKRDPVLARSLFGDFAGKRWWGKIEAMTGPEGFVKTYSVRIGPHLTEDVTVRIRAVLHGDHATYGGSVHDFGQIVQDYLYTQEDQTESSGRTLGGSANPSTERGDGGGGGTVATDISHTGTASTGTQRTRIQRAAEFRGGQLIVHSATFVVDAERTSGLLRDGVAKITGVPREAGPVTLTGTMARVLPDGMVAKRGTVPPQPPARPDVRRVEPPEVFVAERFKADGLLPAVKNRLSQKDLLGKAIEKHRAELNKALTGDGLTIRLERMTGPAGHRLIRLPMPGKPGQVVDVRVHAHLSEPDPVTKGLKDTELGQVDREQNTAGTAADLGQTRPLGLTVSGGFMGVGADVGVGDQTSQSSSGSGGNRDETSVFEKGTAARVRFRVDFDIRFEVREVAADGTETVLRTADIPHGATGTAHLVMFEHELEGMLARRDAGAPRPTWDFDRQLMSAPRLVFAREIVRELAEKDPVYQSAPVRAMAEVLRGKTGTSPVGIAADIGRPDAPGPMALVEEARLLARELGADVHLHLHRPDGAVERYHATPGGELLGDPFAEALGSVPPDLVALAEQHGLDLRDLYGGRSQGFADRIAERLGALGVARPAPKEPGWPVPETAGDATWSGNPLPTAPIAGNVTAQPIARTTFVADGRAPHLPDLSNAEIPAAVAELRPADFGRGVHALTATPDGTAVTVGTTRFGIESFRVLIEDPGGGRLGRTEVGADGGPHVIRLAPRLAPDVVARVLLHEISDTLQRLSVAEQGVLRRFLNVLDPGYDACATARRNEHAYLSRRWRETTSDEERARLRHEIEAVARDLGARGQVAPPPPWITVPPQAPDVGKWELARRLSNISGWAPPDDEDDEDDKTVPEPGNTGQQPRVRSV